MWNDVSDYNQGRKMWDSIDKYSQEKKMWGGVDNYAQNRKMWHDNKMWESFQSHALYSTENRFESSVLDYKKLPPKWYVDNGKEAWLKNIDVMREVVKASKFENAVLYNYPTNTYDKIQKHVDTMSMSDINRYNFRRNHSTEPGLKKQTIGRSPTGIKDWKKLAKQMRKNASSRSVIIKR